MDAGTISRIQLLATGHVALATGFKYKNIAMDTKMTNDPCLLACLLACVGVLKKMVELGGLLYMADDLSPFVNVIWRKTLGPVWSTT